MALIVRSRCEGLLQRHVGEVCTTKPPVAAPAFACSGAASAYPRATQGAKDRKSRPTGRQPCHHLFGRGAHHHPVVVVHGRPSSRSRTAPPPCRFCMGALYLGRAASAYSTPARPPRPRFITIVQPNPGQPAHPEILAAANEIRPCRMAPQFRRLVDGTCRPARPNLVRDPGRAARRRWRPLGRLGANQVWMLSQRAMPPRGHGPGAAGAHEARVVARALVMPTWCSTPKTKNLPQPAGPSKWRTSFSQQAVLASSSGRAEAQRPPVRMCGKSARPGAVASNLKRCAHAPHIGLMYSGPAGRSCAGACRPITRAPRADLRAPVSGRGPDSWACGGICRAISAQWFCVCGGTSWGQNGRFGNGPGWFQMARLPSTSTGTFDAGTRRRWWL